MPLKRLFIVFLIQSLFLSGCLSIDRTPLGDQAPYLRTKALLREIPSQADQDTPPRPLMAGAARAEITPPEGIPLAGYGNRLGRGTLGVHDRLYTRALALSDGDHTVVILANDLLAITDDLYKAVYKKMSRKISLKPDALMVSASHTHSGPGALAKRFWEGFAAGPFDPLFFEEITRKMADTAVEAYRGMKPARLGGGMVPVPELIRNRMVPNGPTDPALSFLVVKTTQPAATFYLVNYSAHPTVLKDTNDLVSGDFPGFLSRHLEEEAGVVVLYTAGAVADQTAHPPPGRDDFEKAERMGVMLAEEVLKASRSAVYSDQIRIGAILATVHLPPTQVKLGPDRRLAGPIGNLFFDRKTVIQAIRLGDYILMGVPCDLSSEIGLEIKEKAKAQGLSALVVGFANDYIGYVIPSGYYHRNIYEARMSFNGPHMDSYMKEVGFELMNKLAGDHR